MLERLRTLFSPQVYPIVMTLAVIVLAIILVSIMRRMVTLALRRVAPHRIDKVTILLQVAVLVGAIFYNPKTRAPAVFTRRRTAA